MTDHQKDNGTKSFHLEGGNIIIDKPKSPEEAAEEARKRESHEFIRDQVKYNKSLRNTTLCLAVASIVGTMIGIWQASISQTAARAAKDAADASKSAAKTAGDTLSEMQHSDKSSGDQFFVQLSKLDASIKEANRLANAMAEQAKATDRFAEQAQRSADYAQQAIQSSITSERPWVGVGHYNVSNFVEGQTSKVSFVFVNSGKRPATATIKIIMDPLQRLPSYPSTANASGSVAFVLPGGTFDTTLDYAVAPNAFSEWKKNRTIFFIYGEVDYTDVGTGTAYITHFCTFYSATDKNQPFPYCTRYNEAK